MSRGAGEQGGGGAIGNPQSVRRVFRRITVGPEERLRTAAERFALLAIATIGPDPAGLSPLLIQQRALAKSGRRTDQGQLSLAPCVQAFDQARARHRLCPWRWDEKLGRQYWHRHRGPAPDCAESLAAVDVVPTATPRPGSR